VLVKQMKKWVDPLLRALFSILFIWVMMAALSNILLSPVSFREYALPALAMYVVLRLLTGSKPGRITGMVLLVPAALFLLFLLLDRGEAHKALMVWGTGLFQAFEKLYWFEPLVGTRHEMFQTPVILMLTALTTVWVWAFHERRFRFLPLVGYGMACILLSYEMSGDSALVPFLLFVPLAVSAYAGSVHDRRRREAVDNPETGTGRIMFQALPVALLALVLTLPFQKPDTALRWSWLEQKASDLYARFEAQFTHTDTEFFSLSATGFAGRENLLGGRVRQSNTFVMEVRADRRAYLRGAAYQNYTGVSWMLADPGFDYVDDGYPESARDLDEMGAVYKLVPPDLIHGMPEPAEASGSEGSASENSASENSASEGSGTETSGLDTSAAEASGTPADSLFPEIPRRAVFADASQRMLAQKLASGELTDLLFPSLRMDITYRSMTTRTLFAPLKTELPIRNAQGGVQPVTQNNRGIMLAPAFLGSGSQYSLGYRQPMYGDEILKNLLPLSRKGLYEDAARAYVAAWNQLVGMAEWGGIFTQDATEADATASAASALVASNMTEPESGQASQPDMAALSTYVVEHRNPFDTPVYQQLQSLEMRATELHRKYTTLPVTVTDRTRQFARDLTEGLNSNYEKAIAVRDALRELYPYTLVMPRLPEDRDFTDWFLFEQQSGYCTSYATAMAVLLRTLDIPARYVEGYVLPEKNEDEDFYRVTNRYAHAWTEVYFEGFGWLSFEPTPGFAGTTDFLAQNAVDMSEYMDSPYMPDLEELMRMYGQNRELGDYDPGLAAPVETREPLAPGTLVLLILGSLALLVMLVDSASRLVEALRHGRTPPRRQVVYRYLRMLDWLALAGVTLGEGESLPEFSRRVDSEYYFPESSFRALSALFSKVRYGAGDPTAAEVRLVRNMARELKGQIVREIGLRRLLPLRHLLLRI
jgi:hypothetical protein